MASNARLIPIYTSRGDLGAFLLYPYLFNRTGEWIGWVTQDRQVFSVHGHYAGYLDNGPRVLRKASDGFDRPRRQPPPHPPKVQLPVTVPLAPMMAELTYGLVDVLEDAPELLPSLDSGELREDMD
jgi:hypothetical protein